MKVKVAINGYGTIGKRVADAVSKQDDMEVIGVTKTKPDFEAKMAIRKGYKLYCAIPENLELFESAGIRVEGTVDDLINKADIVVDCSPGKVGAQNKPMYEKAGVKAIFQGGEKKDVAELSFNALANYEKAVGKNYVRVVSCNTTGLVRVLYLLDTNFGIEKVRAVMIRRVVDPKEDKKGLVNGIMPDPVKLPSHHGPDVQTVLPHIDITTVAFKVPTTLMHVHSLNVQLKEKASEDDVIDVFEKEPRILLVSKDDGFTSTAKIIEWARELRIRYDLFENVVWRDSIAVVGNELYLTQAIHQEAIVVPENIDAIRAMLEMADKEESIRKTNESLDIGKFQI
ncbi:type II glyceraldehyde-3-phosphate dehydrogenase [Archaeoglobus profundus]|uniref:Glyceraldehyde-3-phosphate dehydrogenase n=1 Tax=Archaeoglobus profundus (strain DSM 5631 / JCM 9629 / NBRC 100127 / Av18) TaxID=572546 RepID=D2RHM1_ARCPA|nr:type II glyceraldehyde-3-phosphate dehydrogenase [Archaeoglobus profundus]ADB57796.1 glyceraldehyde-3-phosphate dehydrogenase, type II [Archaeoglobus profundus DSM 5631]